MGFGARVKAKTLKQIGAGNTFTLTAKPLTQVDTADGPAYLATLSNGEQLWIAARIQSRLSGTPEGTYKVISFETDYGNPGYDIEPVA